MLRQKEMLSCENIKTLHALYDEIEKMKENLSNKEVTLNEKTLKIESLKSENTTIEEKNSELNRELNNSMQMLEELKVKNNELICHVASLKGQYDQDDTQDTSFPSTLKTLQDEISLHKLENNKLEGDINTYREKLIDQGQEQEIDECSCKDMSLKLDLLVAENMKYEMKIVELNKELNQHADGCGCNEKSTKIDLLIEENMKHEKKIAKLNEEMNNYSQISEDLKKENGKLLLQIEELNKQYERSRIESDDVTMYVGQDLQNKVLQLEIQKKKLEITNSAYKNQLMEYRDCNINSITKKSKNSTEDTFSASNLELQFQIEQLKEDATTILQDNEYLRSSKAELQSELEKLKGDAKRLKSSNDKYKENFFTKTLEIESVLSENALLKKDSIHLHRPCNNKIDSLEAELNAVKEVNTTMTTKFVHLKDKYDAVKWKLNQEECDASMEESHMKMEDDDILKVNGMKGECVKLVYVLRRIKKDYHRLKTTLKMAEKEKDSTKLENEKLKLDNKNMKADFDELKAQKAKLENDNLELTASLTLWKHTEAARSSANKILKERLKSRAFGRPFL